MPHQSHRQPSFIKLLTVSLLLSLSNFSTPSQAKDLNSMDMERSAYEIVRRHGREGEGRAAEGKPLMQIEVREGGVGGGGEEKELQHQKEEANPEKFQRKTRLKRDVEDIFLLDGSKQKRNEYINQNIKDQSEKKKKRTWADLFGIVKDDPNSQEIVVCLALIFIFVGILMTLICCICMYWCHDRQKMKKLELNQSVYHTAEF